jgi:hypothetical protein
MGDGEMSIVRVGLAETKNFSDGYDRIFGKKKDDKDEKKEQAAAEPKQDEAKEPEKK